MAASRVQPVASMVMRCISMQRSSQLGHCPLVNLNPMPRAEVMTDLIVTVEGIMDRLKVLIEAGCVDHIRKLLLHLWSHWKLCRQEMQEGSRLA